MHFFVHAGKVHNLCADVRPHFRQECSVLFWGLILTKIILLRAHYYKSFFETLLVSVGMEMGGNRDYFSGIHGNWNIQSGSN